MTHTTIAYFLIIVGWISAFVFFNTRDKYHMNTSQTIMFAIVFYTPIFVASYFMLKWSF